MKDFKEFEIGDNVQVVRDYYTYEGVIKGEASGYYVVESELYGIQKVDVDTLRHTFPVSKMKTHFTPTDKMKYLLEEIYKVNLINEDEFKLGKVNGHLCSMFISLYVNKMYAIRKASTPRRSYGGRSYTTSSGYSAPSTRYEEDDDYTPRFGFSYAGEDDDDDDCAPGLFGDMWSKSSRRGGFSFANGDEDEEDDLRPGCGW